MKTLLKNGQLVLENSLAFGDILIENGEIVGIGNNLIAEGAKVFDIAGKTVFPGLIDMHVHLREPGQEYKETIASGAHAAVAGGFSQIACMPNTKPVCDCVAVASFIKTQGKLAGLCKVHPIGAVTKGEAGEELAEIGLMKEAGIVAISDDGKPVSEAGMMMRAMQYAAGFGLKVLSHCEDKTISMDGVVNEGYNSSLAGLKGISRAAEEVMAAREIVLAETLGVAVHLCHISTRGTVQLVREAKARGVKVSAETCPHYFAACDDLILGYDSATKVNPPLRTADDRRAIIDGLLDGTIDCIATDHAPHHIDDKNVEYNSAAFGISGLETAFSLAVTVLLNEEKMTAVALKNLMSKHPAEVLNLVGGQLKVGAPADIMVADLQKTYQIDRAKFFSKGKNTPFHGKTVAGKVEMTFVDGVLVYQA